MVSLRENVAADSLHVVVDGNRVAAHVDGVSPLALQSEGSAYSVSRALTHNLAGMAQDVVSLLRGRQGDHGCELNCEWATGDATAVNAHAPGVQLEARVGGPLDEARLRAALGVVLGDRTPALEPLEVVECDDDDALDAARARLHGLAIAIDQWPPLHAYLARHRDGDVLMLNVNHAAADGVGALRVLQAIATAYAGDSDPGVPLDFLAAADLPVRPAAETVSRPVRIGKRALERVRDGLARPARLAVDESEDRPGHGFHHVALPADDTEHILGSDRSAHILMAALHLTIGEWNHEHGKPGGQIGVLAPANLRPGDWRADAVGNFSVTARVSTSHRDRADAASVLEAISGEIARNERTRTGIALIAALKRADLLTLWAKQSIVVLEPLTANRLVDTAMLCDLGRLDEAPSFGRDVGPVVAMWHSTPSRSPMSLSLGAATVHGRLHLTFRYPHRLFGPDAARRFAASYLDHLQRVAELQQAPGFCEQKFSNSPPPACAPPVVD